MGKVLRTNRSMSKFSKWKCNWRLPSSRETQVPKNKKKLHITRLLFFDLFTLVLGFFQRCATSFWTDQLGFLCVYARYLVGIHIFAFSDQFIRTKINLDPISNIENIRNLVERALIWLLLPWIYTQKYWFICILQRRLQYAQFSCEELFRFCWSGLFGNHRQTRAPWLRNLVFGRRAKMSNRFEFIKVKTLLVLSIHAKSNTFHFTNIIHSFDITEFCHSVNRNLQKPKIDRILL